MWRVIFVCVGLSPALAQAQVDLSGTWAFTHAKGQFEGTITVTQSADGIAGVWHTAKGKSEEDSGVAATVRGNRVALRRLVDGQIQDYILTLSADGMRLDGFGEGYFRNHTNLNMQRLVAPLPPPPAVPASAKKGDHLSWPAARGTYIWAIQSVRVGMPPNIKYTSFYYEAPTDRSVEQPLTLPAGGTIVSVFPDDCQFMMRDTVGNSITFKNAEEAKAHGLRPGTWSVFPQKCNGVVMFVK